MTVHADVLKKKLHCRFKHSPVYSCSISSSYFYVLDRYTFDLKVSEALQFYLCICISGNSIFEVLT